MNIRQWYRGIDQGAGIYDLSEETGWLHCYSFAKRFPAYSGACLRLVRDSDSAELDINFVDDLIDFSAINTFCSGTTGRVKIFYDQFGIKNLLGIGVRPIIYESGAFLGFISNVGIAGAFEFSSTFTLNQNYTVITSFRRARNILNQRSSSPNAGMLLEVNNAGGFGLVYYGVNTFSYGGFPGLETDGSKKYIAAYHQSNTSFKSGVWVDGGDFTENSPGTISSSQNSATNITKIGIALTSAGAISGTGFLKFTELFLFSGDQAYNTNIFDKRYIP